MSPLQRLLYSLGVVVIAVTLIASGMAVERLMSEAKPSQPQQTAQFDSRKRPRTESRPSSTAPAANAAFPASPAGREVKSAEGISKTDAPGASPGPRQTLIDEEPLDVANRIAIADQALKMGDFASALRGYEEAWPRTTGVATASLLFRKGLAAEAMGELTLALDCYRELIWAAKENRWAAPGLIGQCRCWIALRRPEMIAAEVLPQVLLDPTHLPESARAELLHLAAMAASIKELERTEQNLLDEDVLPVPLWRVDPILVLEQLPEMLSDRQFPQRQRGLTVLQKLDDSPEGLFLAVGASRTSLPVVLASIVQSSGYTLDLSPRAAGLLGGHTQAVHVKDQSLALILDGICTPHELIWTFDNRSVRIRTADELSTQQRLDYSRKSSRRLLQLAVTMAPDNPISVWNRIAWGRVLFRLGQPADGVGMLRGVLKERTTPELAASAAFSLGKCLMALGQVDEAELAFLRCVDSGSRDEILSGAAYLYVGRLLLERGDVRQANSPCMRALALSRGTRQEADATLMLACQYLLSNNPQGANSVLMEHRHALTSPLHRDSGAFLAALARYSAAVLDDRREREARSLTIALTHMHPERNLGAHWWLLVGNAFEKIGLVDNAAETYLRALKAVQNSPLRSDVLMRLAAINVERGREPDAKQILAALTTAERQEVRWPASISVARLALSQGRLTESIDRCREVLDECKDDQTRREALRLLGRAYQAQENYAAAIACFSGQLPQAEFPPGEPLEPDKAGR